MIKSKKISTLLAIIIIIAEIIILFGGIFIYQHYFSIKEFNTFSSTNKNTIANTVTSSTKILTAEEISKRKTDCKNIQNYYDQNSCYGNLAIDVNDPSICPEFGSSVCKYFIFMWYTDLCSDITISKPIYGLDKDQVTFQDLNKKQECIKNIAIDTKNIKLCGNLFSGASDCQNTIAVELNAPSKCSDYGNCVMEVAVNKKDINICESKYDKAWCIAEFPRLLQESSYAQNPQCYMQPMDIDAGMTNMPQPEYDYSYPNTYDNGANDYPKDVAPQPYFKHFLSIPFNNGNTVLRVYVSSGTDGFMRFIKYSLSSGSSELVGDIVSETGANWGGIYMPFAISKDDSHIIFKAQMGPPGAGGGSATLGYASLSLASPKYDDCGYLNPEEIAEHVYFYDNFSKAIFYTEASNVPKSEKPGPDYNSSIRFDNIITGETKTLLEEPNTIYENTNVDEKSGVVNFKSCPWQEYRFECPSSDTAVQERSLNLP